MELSKSEAVDYLFSEMLKKGISIDDLCKKWGGKFVADDEVRVVSEPLPFKVLYKSGQIYDHKVLGEIPMAILVEHCFVSLWDLPQKYSFSEALGEAAQVKFYGYAANMGTRETWDFLFKNADGVNHEIETLGGQKIDFSSAYWIYSVGYGSVYSCFKKGVEKIASKSQEFNVRPMYLLP